MKINLKRVEAFVVLVAVLMTGTGCGVKNTESASKEGNVVTSSPDLQEEEPLVTEQPMEYITWMEDVTHDGIKDKIELNLTYLNQDISTGEEQTVCIYSGKTGEKIWFFHAGTCHVDWGSIYVYQNPSDDKVYLLNWVPYICCGSGAFRYTIFSLDETGKEENLETGRLEFSTDIPKEGEVEKMNSFVEKVNKYLKESYVVVDTDEGCICYSKQDKPEMKLYDSSCVEEWMSN